MSAGKPPAFVLLGGLRVIVRNWRYLTELDRRGLKILVLTSSGWRAETLACLAATEGAGALIHDAGFVEGKVELDGSFTAGVIAQVHRWQDRYRIEGVFAAGEMLVEQTGLVADALGLPAPGLRAARVCRNKYLQRFYLRDLGPAVTVVPPGERASLEAAALKYPVVLKPSGRRSSSGVRQIADAEELHRHLGDYLDGETLLVETRVTGPEYSVEALVQHGRIVFESLTLKHTNEASAESFVELGHSVPAPEAHGNAALLAANREVVARLGFTDGVVHSELRLGDDGAVTLMEVAARTPGDGILPLYQLATGSPMEPAIVRIALGEPADYPAPRRFARQVYVEHEPGMLRSVRLDWDGVEPVWVGKGEFWPELTPGEPDDPPALRAVLVLKEEGSPLGPLRESDDRAVTFLIDAPTVAELDELEARVRERIEIVVDRGAH
ncbi:ATP-grasp domain-containing protein [Saccharothrix sp. AJ9571]|nr:ATP-grasp domain-containing protein [Saccharothrix sp. AJ9571]